MIVLGNGESRQSIDLTKLQGPFIGCNAIYRDFKTDHLVCVDRRMLHEALENDVNYDSLVYTRPQWFEQYKVKRLRQVPSLPYAGLERPDDPTHWGSGPYAVLLGAKLSRERKVHMLGFDLYSKTQKVNNVYKGTSNYIAAEKSAVDPSYWIWQIGKIFENFPKTTFTIYKEEGWAKPKIWNYSNVKVDNISNIYYNT